MSDNNEEKQLADLQSEAVASPTEATVNSETETLTKEYAEKVSVLESTIAEKDLALKTSEEKIASLEETLASKDKELSDLSAAMKDMQKKEKDRMRKEKLVMAGFEDAEAEESLAIYDNLGDEAFDQIVAVFKKKMPKDKKVEFKENITKDEPQESDNPKAAVAEVATEEVSEELFQEVKTTEATLVDASDVVDELAATRASVAQWLEQNVLNK